MKINDENVGPLGGWQNRSIPFRHHRLGSRMRKASEVGMRKRSGATPEQGEKEICVQPMLGVQHGSQIINPNTKVEGIEK